MIHYNRYLRQAQAQLRQAKSQHKELRKTFLAQREHETANDPNQRRAHKAIKRIHNTERRSRAHQRIGHVFKPRSEGGVSHLLIPKGLQPKDYPYDPETVTEWESIHDPERIQDYLLARNRAHFSQADGTPFTTVPLNSIGHAADTDIADSILNGHIPESLADADEYALDIIKEIANSTLPPLAINFDTSSIKQGFRKWKERTSTSPSGLHLGIWKTLAQSSENEEEQMCTNRLWSVHTSLLNIPFITGQPLNRWKKIINSMLEKIPGKPYLHKLRVIHLLEADYNLALKSAFGRQLMWHCEDNGAFDEGAGGGRPGRGTLDISITQEMIYDINRRYRTNHATNLNDAKACYDRIIPTLTSLINRANGMPKSWVQTHANLLAEAKYHLKTISGISARYHTHSEEHPVYGNGQGAGDSPNQWNQTSSIILQLFFAMAHRAILESPFRDLKVEQATDAFIDDANNYNNDDEQHSMSPSLRLDAPHRLLQWLKTDLTHWDRLLWATGGELELPKCAFYVTVWHFNDDGTARPYTPQELDIQLHIQRPDGTSFYIQQLDSNTASKLLGIMRSPTGNQQPELQALQKKSNDMTRKLTTGGLSHSDTHIAYFTNYLPSMTYSLNVTSIGPVPLRQMQKHAKAAFLSGMGYNRHMPNALVYGSRKFGGIGLRDLGDEEGILGTAALLRFLNMQHKTKPATLVRIDLDKIQQEAGISQHILTDTRPLPYLEHGWSMS